MPEDCHLGQRVGPIDGGSDLTVDVGQVGLEKLPIRLVVVGDQHPVATTVGW